MKLEDYPRPNKQELPGLYAELDKLLLRVEKTIKKLPKRFLDKEIIRFGKIGEFELKKLISEDPEMMVKALTRVCGLTVRECSRLFGLKEVYRLCSSKNWIPGGKDENLFIKIVMDLLPEEMCLETFLYTFYKMWEGDQRRHYRAKFEKEIRKFFRARGYNCEKITKPIEADAAIPPDDPRVLIQTRVGVIRDLEKRAKEFNSEFTHTTREFPDARFVVIYNIPPHELGRRDEFRQKILGRRIGRRSYDAVFFQDELELALQRFKEWRIPKAR